MVEVRVYIMGGNEEPDRITCMVPFSSGKGRIFFGPCMKSIRRDFRKRDPNPGEGIYLVGINNATKRKDRNWVDGKRKIRKILWAGRVTGIMTFGEAYSKLKGDPGFKEMVKRDDSPLHVKPIRKGRRLAGYKHRSTYHGDKEKWIKDFMVVQGGTVKNDQRVMLKGDELRLKAGYDAVDVFVRDCCFMCESIFFANDYGEGLSMSDEIVSILRKDQNDRSVKRFAPFGIRNGMLNGRRGNGLTMKSANGMALVDEIKRQIRKQGLRKRRRPVDVGKSKSDCGKGWFLEVGDC